MATFLLYVFLIVCLGIFIRLFWIPLAFIAGILFIILGIIVCAGVTAITLEMMHAMTTDGTWTGFSTYFKYSAAIYTALVVIYMVIIGDIVNIADGYLRGLFKKS